MDWTVDLLAQAMGAPEHLPISGDARWSPRGPESAARLFIGDFLQDAWATTIRDGSVVAVIVLDDAEVTWDRLRQWGQTPAEATRHAVAIATSFGDLTGQARVLMVTRSAWDDPAAVSARILGHVGLQPHDAVAGSLAPVRPALPIAEFQAWIEAVAAPAFAYGQSGKPRPVTWARERLFWGDKPGEAAPRVLDLTGPSRILAYGPYLALPPGRWTMSTTFALSPASQGAMLSLTLCSAVDLGRIEFRVQSPGLFKASVPVVVPSGREPLEIRLVSERGAIEGMIGMDDILFTPE